MEFAENLKNARRVLKLTQKDLAERCQLTQPQICHLESGKHEPRLSTAIAVARALEMSLDDLTVGQNSRKQQARVLNQIGGQLPDRKIQPRKYTGKIPIPERFHCMAEQRSRRYRVDLEYEDIGEELLLLRKKAFDLYGATCLWNIAGHATISGMRGIAGGLQNYGDLDAARLAAVILEKTGCKLIAP